jgi:uncharacterized membrane protein
MWSASVSGRLEAMTTATVAPPATARPWRLSGRARKILLVTHIVAAGIWIGLDVAMAVLVFTAMSADDRLTAAAALQMLRLITVWPMATTGLVTLVTGVVLGLGSKYGLVRYWWVLIKLVVNVVLCILVLTALRGGVAEAAAAGRQMAAGTLDGWTSSDMIFPPIVSTGALLSAFLLSVFKPWGRVRRQPQDLPGSPNRSASFNRKAG